MFLICQTDSDSYSRQIIVQIQRIGKSRQKSMSLVLQDLCVDIIRVFKKKKKLCLRTFGPRQANLVLIAYASSEGSGEPAHPRSLARTFAAPSYKQ